MYNKYTSYGQILDGFHDETHLLTEDYRYYSDAIPRYIRETSNGQECRKYYVHHNYGDGFGHQLLDLAAAMVYHLLNPTQFCFLGILYYDGEYNQFDHGCRSCIGIYNALSSQWPGINPSFTNRTIHKFDSTKLWSAILNASDEKKYHVIHCPRCDRARMAVAQLWVDTVKTIATKRNTPTVDIAIHIRKGDFPREVSTSYSVVIERLFPHAVIDLFTENHGESHEVLVQLSKTHEVRLHEGGDAVEDWLTLVRAKVLFVHQSSFSISASIASEGLVFSQHQKPYQGRYDNHYFPCELDGGWFVSMGHGNPVCDEDKILAVSLALTEKYAN